jgi:hypothetical protein
MGASRAKGSIFINYSRKDCMRIMCRNMELLSISLKEGENRENFRPHGHLIIRRERKSLNIPT